jgi:hypothetical protein
MFLLFILSQLLVLFLVPTLAAREAVCRKGGVLNSQGYSWVYLALVLTLAMYFVVPSGELGNRILHFVGGGVSCALITQGFLQLSGLRLRWIDEFLLFVAVACVLGVTNELVELLMGILLERNYFTKTILDTQYDLLMNTAGVTVGWLLLRLVPARLRV